MKPLKLLWLLVPLVLVIAASDGPQNITFRWEYSPEDLTPDTVFILHSALRVDAPLPWPVIRTVPGTNTQLTLSVMPSKVFYYLTASNFWGESDPSNVAATPAPPRPGVLTVVRGPL